MSSGLSNNRVKPLATAGSSVSWLRLAGLLVLLLLITLLAKMEIIGLIMFLRACTPFRAAAQKILDGQSA